MNTDVLLSIIIPAFNAAMTLPRTLRSLRRISSANRARVQIVLVNDGSTDQTWRLMRELRETGGFGCVTAIEQANGGTSAARNVGLNAARGDWVFLLDADDELAFDPVPHVRRWQGKATCLGFPVILRRGSVRYHWQPKRLTPRSHLNVLTAKSAFYPCNLIFRADRVTRAFEPRYRYNEDWHFWLANPRVFERMQLCSAVSAIVHAHGTNKSSNFEARGRFRTLIAEEFLADHRDLLTPRQANNLKLQARIGRLQLGESVPLSTLIGFPCDAFLYLKLLVYLSLRRKLARIELYRPLLGDRTGPDRRKAARATEPTRAGSRENCRAKQ